MRTVVIALGAFLPLIVSCSEPSVQTEGSDTAVSQAPDQARQSRPPNILLIIGDDHGWPYYGFLGDENVVTPHLDALAERSVVFELAHSTSNYCRPDIAEPCDRALSQPVHAAYGGARRADPGR